MTPILYLLFIDRYATNSFYSDDWSAAPVIHDALNHHLSLSQLWAQYNESRLFLQRIVDVIFGRIDQFDLRSVIVFSGTVLIASYAVLLGLFRRYLGSQLTPIPVLVVGVVWFSLADVENALWADQVGWYLTLFLFVAMLFALQAPRRHLTGWFVVAVVAACAASSSTVQGLWCWPLGAVCILWRQPSVRRTIREIAVWCGTAIVSVVLYLPGYDFNRNGCLPPANCSARFALHHPLTALGFLVALVGNVIPGGIAFGRVDHVVHNVARFEVVGVVLFAMAGFILVQEWRDRRSKERLPIPSLLIGFSLLWDVTIALGRGAGGPFGAANTNRYVMANLVLLTGIVMYAWAHLPSPRRTALNNARRSPLVWLVPIALALFLVVQVTEATRFGLTNGGAIRAVLDQEARFVVNEDRVPARALRCEAFIELAVPPGWSSAKQHAAEEDHLGEFAPDPYRYYRVLGPRVLSPECSKVVHASRPT